MSKQQGSRVTSSSRRRQVSSGAKLERRVGRLFFWSDYFVRTGVDLREAFGGEPLQLTDLDLLAYHFTEFLTVEKTIGETKSGTSKNSPKPLDRTFWLAGLKQYTDADAAVLVSARGVRPDLRRTANALGIRIISTDEIRKLEDDAGIDQLDFGSFAAEHDGLWQSLRADAKLEMVLDRAWKFIGSTVWQLEPWIALKRTLSMLQRISRHWSDTRTAGRHDLVRSLLVEGCIVFSWAALQIAGSLRWLPPEEANVLLDERLSEGLATKSQLEALSKAVDQYVMALLSEAGVPESTKVGALGAFDPRPPDWATPFAELALRLGQEPRESRSLPRLLDVCLYETVVAGREVQSAALSGLNLPNAAASLRLARVVGKFLEVHAGVPREIFSGLNLSPRAEEAPGQPQLLLEANDRFDADGEP